MSTAPTRRTPRIALATPQAPLRGVLGVTTNFTKDAYLAAVRRTIEYINAGDCFQVNIAQRLLHPATMPPLELYGRLRERNAAPFAGFFDLGDFALASAAVPIGQGRSTRRSSARVLISTSISRTSATSVSRSRSWVNGPE